MSCDYFDRGAIAGDDPRPESVLFHRGDRQGVLSLYLTKVNRAHQGGMRGVQSLAPLLFRTISDERTLRIAWDHLERHGGIAPGADGLTYGDFRESEVWELCRCLRESIRCGTYHRGPDRIVRISKGPGRGRRPLVVSNIADRVVERAVVTVLTPLLDPLFDDHSFGFRTRRGYQHALALAERRTIVQRRRTWLIDDLKDAFLHVPIPRLLQVVRKLLPADDLIELLGRLFAGNTLAGLRQGGPLSPLMLNVYLNHFLDRPWRRDHPDLPLIRFADDLLIPCRSHSQAISARADLERLMRAAATPLKGSLATSVHVLDSVVPTSWLGFDIAKPSRGLAIRLGDRAWEVLDEQLALTHTKPDSPLRAVQVIQGWLAQRGPCYHSSDREDVCRRIREIAMGHAFDEIPGPGELLSLWKAAEGRWRKARIKAREDLRTPKASVLDRPAITPPIPPVRVGSLFEDRARSARTPS